jgi:hypothetical protein
VNCNYLCVGSVAMLGWLGQYVKSCFLVLCVNVPILSFHIPILIDTFPFELICFRFLVNPIFVFIYGLPKFDFICIIKCKSENGGVYLDQSCLFSSLLLCKQKIECNVFIECMHNAMR